MSLDDQTVFAVAVVVAVAVAVGMFVLTDRLNKGVGMLAAVAGIGVALALRKLSKVVSCTRGGFDAVDE